MGAFCLFIMGGKFVIHKRNAFAAALISAFLPFMIQRCPAIEEDAKASAVKLNQAAVEAVDRGEIEKAIKDFKSALYWDPTNDTIRTNLARASNLYAVELLEKGETETAIAVLREALEAGMEEEIIKKNLSAALTRKGGILYDAGQPDLSRKELEEAVKLDGVNAGAWGLLGRIAYYQQELQLARECWENSLRINPDQPELSRKLAELKEETGREEEFRKNITWIFDINYDRGVEAAQVENVRDYLREAYRALGREFDYYPDRKIVVLVYLAKDFRSLPRTPGWASGLYDGKIRVPFLPNEVGRPDLLRKIIWHEYAHVLVHDLSGGNCPGWLAEGLAKHLEPESNQAVFSRLRRAVNKGSVIPLSRLEGEFARIEDKAKVDLAYEEAQSVVEYMISIRRFSGVRETLDRLKKGEPAAAVMDDLFRIGGRGLEERWLAEIKDKHGGRETD